MPGGMTTRVPVYKSVVWLDWGTAGFSPPVCCSQGTRLTPRPLRQSLSQGRAITSISGHWKHSCQYLFLSCVLCQNFQHSADVLQLHFLALAKNVPMSNCNSIKTLAVWRIAIPDSFHFPVCANTKHSIHFTQTMSCWLRLWSRGFYQGSSHRRIGESSWLLRGRKLNRSRICRRASMSSSNALWATPRHNSNHDDNDNGNDDEFDKLMGKTRAI